MVRKDRLELKDEEKTTNVKNPLLWWIIGAIVFGGLAIVSIATSPIGTINAAAWLFLALTAICIIGIAFDKHNEGTV